MVMMQENKLPATRRKANKAQLEEKGMLAALVVDMQTEVQSMHDISDDKIEHARLNSRWL